MISIIHTPTQRPEAEDIASFLTTEKKLTISSNLRTDTCITLQSDSRICQDSAIIIVSDTAVRDQQWQAAVRAISDEIRIISVGGTEDADYSDPEVIPKRIEEINFIRMDENCNQNIWASLTTEKDYFDIKNMILFNMNTWLFSKGSEDFLLTDIKAIRQYLSRFQKKFEEEKNTYFREELYRIIEYLRFSLHYAKGLRRKRILSNIGRTAVVIVSAFMVTILYIGARYIGHLHYTEAVLDVGVDPATAPINAVKLVDGLSNPVNFGIAQVEALYQLIEHLNANWYNTPTGWDYKWPLNDAQIAMDERYFWSANENGAIIKWDTYTGMYVEQEMVSSNPLNAIAFSENESLFVVQDSEGYLFKKSHGGAWERSEINYDIPFSQDTILRCNEEENVAVVAGSNGKIFYFDITNGMELLWEGQYDRTFCAELSGHGLEVVIRDHDTLYDACIKKNGDVSKTKIPIIPSDICSMDIFQGRILMADENSQLVIWEKNSPQNVNPIGTTLSRPYHVCFFNNEVIVYQDLDTGVYLYDLEQRLNLGRILGETAAVSSLSASHNTVLAGSTADKSYHTENVEALLPIKEIKDKHSYIAYTGNEMSSDGMIRHVSIDEEYKIYIDLHVDEGDVSYIIDSRSPFYNKIENEKLDLYRDKPINSMNRPLIVGIHQNGDTLLVGCTDGSFYEIVFTRYGEYMCTSQLHIPSHAAVAAIYQAEDFYYIEDVTGRLWRARMGYDTITEEGWVAAVKEKLHCALADEFYDVFSKDTVKKLDLQRMPSDGTEVWE